MKPAEPAPQQTCRRCGTPLKVGVASKLCAQCVAPNEIKQLELTFVAGPGAKATRAPTGSAEASPARPPAPPSAPRRGGQVVGLFILCAGFGWAALQLWPSGPTHRALVSSIEARPRFEARTGDASPLGNLRVSRESAPTLVDLDGDADLDLVCGTGDGEIRVFLNEGTVRRARFTAVPDRFGLVRTDTWSAFAFADLDRDGDPDVVTAGIHGQITSFVNNGSRWYPMFSLLDPERDPFRIIQSPPESLAWKVAFGDLDGDGTLDALVGSAEGSLLLYRNRGSRRQPAFADEPLIAPFGLEAPDALTAPVIGDLDQDGDFDVLCGTSRGGSVFFENIGTRLRPKFASGVSGAFGLPADGNHLVPTMGDLNGDGDLDVIIGSGDGSLRYFENVAAPPP